MSDFAYGERDVREAVRNADGTSGSGAGEQSKTLLALQMPVRKGNRCGGVAFKKRTYKELRLLPQNSTETGHRGVYRRENNRWRASIGFQGKVYYLGSFESFEDAVEARLMAEERLYDTFLKQYAEKKNYNDTPAQYQNKGADGQ